MSDEPSMRIMPRKLIVLLGALALQASLALSASIDAHPDLSDSIDVSATPATPVDIRSGIDIGPIRELNPIFRGALEDDAPSEFVHLVEDPNEVLSRSQTNELAEDAHRLTVHGIPTMVVLRESSQSPDESAAFADRLRLERNLETAPGADDGILFLVTQKAESSRRSMVVTISYGVHTLPKGGLNEESLQDVYQRSIRPRLRFGLVADALKIGMRKIIYLETYFPDPSPPLTSLQKATQGIVNVAAPVLSFAGVVSVIAAWRSVRHRSTRCHHRARLRSAAAIVLAVVLVMILAILSVYSQSGLGIVAVVVGVLTCAAHVRFLDGKPKRQRPLPRRVHAASRFSGKRSLRAEP